MEIVQQYIQNFTHLPLKIVMVATKQLPDIFVTTPHKGEVVVSLKEEHHALFGAPSQFDKHAKQVIGELQNLEEEAKEYLFNKWLKTI